MKRFLMVLLLLAILLSTGCGAGQANSTPAETVYTSDTSAEDCYLCGGGIEDLIPSYWGQDNIALISLNTFEIKPIEINRYDRVTGQFIEEYAGTVSFGGGGSIDGGFSASLLIDYDRGYATGILDFCGDDVLAPDKAADFLCADCPNEILPPQIDRCFGVGAIHLDTKEVCVFEKPLGGFGLGDFYMDCNRMEQRGSSEQMDILIFYCPIRYKEGT